jgi:uncharacterized protein YceH (UPF0502 family)|tara:strand:+ start:1854 stop:2516 length:663 start_codon:yes stop_codon:yes gene_type:complete
MSHLSDTEVRVLGVLMGKAATTPDQYPLSLNGLTLGCNQKTSRDPVTTLDDDEAEAALDELRDRRLAFRVDMAGSRVPKYRHQADESWELTRAEYALLTVLLLRGPQSLGQLRQRTERIHAFRDLDEVRDTLEGMEQRELEPQTLVRELPHRAGTKDIRYAHVLGAPIEKSAAEAVTEVESPLAPSPRELEIEELKAEVAELKNSLQKMREEFDQFRSQF